MAGGRSTRSAMRPKAIPPIALAMSAAVTGSVTSSFERVREPEFGANRQ
jgi:hypothetical protein